MLRCNSKGKFYIPQVQTWEVSLFSYFFPPPKTLVNCAWTRMFSFVVISKSSLVSAAAHSSIGSTATAATTRPSTTWAAVWITGRVASIDRGGRAPILPAHSFTTARWVWVTPTAGVTVTTAIAIPGTAAIVIVTTASTAPTIGWWGAPWRRGAARVTCRVNGSGNWKVQLIHFLALSCAHFFCQ